MTRDLTKKLAEQLHLSKAETVRVALRVLEIAIGGHRALPVFPGDVLWTPIGVGQVRVIRDPQGPIIECRPYEEKTE